jgi:hypothetical protein
MPAFPKHYIIALRSPSKSMRCWIILAVGFNFYNFPYQQFGVDFPNNVLTEKVTGKLKCRTEIKRAGERFQ